MSTKFHLGTTPSGAIFELSLDMVTASCAILAKKRVGKSYTAAVLSECMLEAGQQVVIVDPTGAHWGLRSSADGKREGFPIVVIGGDHADLPLDDTAGEAIARALVERRFSAILDLSLLRKGATTRFLGAFFETMYRLNRQPLHLICDEVDIYAPQKPFADEARTLGAMEDIVRRGGIRGIGTTMITQRPAIVNKNVLTQCEILIALRLVHPKDIAAVMEWVNVHAELAQAKRMLESLPSLPIGTAWVWSPGWEIFERVAVRKRATFDSGATPKPGEVVITPQVLARVDLEQLGADIAATVEAVKADDPKALRARIAELEKQLAAKPVGAADQQAIAQAEIEAETRGIHAGRAEVLAKLGAVTQSLMDAASYIAGAQSQITSIAAFAEGAPTKLSPEGFVAQLVAKPAAEVQVQRKTAGGAGAAASAPGLTGPEQRILDAIAWMNAIGVAEPDQHAVGFIAGYSIDGSAYKSPRASLRTKDLVEYLGDSIKLTPAGRKLARSPAAPATTKELHQRVLDRLAGPETKLLTVALQVYPKAISNEDLGKRTGYSIDGSAFKSPRAKLRTLGLIEYVAGGVRARDILFPEGR